MSNNSKRFLILILLVTLVESSLSIKDILIETNNSLDLEKRDSKVNNEYRLPKSVVPTAYDIKFLEIDFLEFTFKGTIRINAKIKEQTKKIIFHQKNLTVLVTSVNNIRDKTKLRISTTSYNETTEMFTIVLEEFLKPAESISIKINFNGSLRKDMLGFYSSSYINERGEERWLAATQFESTYARYAFPCFDEPAFKSTFNISIFRPNGYGCLSNMVSKNEGNWCVFGESVSMSTYLVAFVVSDFALLEKTDSTLRVWSRPNALKQTWYSHRIGVAAIAYFEDLFDEPYQLPKLDMVALPDFSSGAMENWGLITYRETALLYDEVDTSAAAKQSLASVIVHECSHMWFGNLVTPDWWSYLWLSEAFARYFQYMAMNEIETNWKMDQQFLVDQFQLALSIDGLENSVAMTRSAVTPADIAKMGGIITYSKGASIVRMMERLFGSDTFISSLRAYLKARKYKTAEPDDLWQALQKGIGAVQESKLNVSVARVMKTWTEQPGFPYISVTIKPNYITFSQQRFLLRNTNTVPTDSTWWVPITWMSSSQANSNSQSTKPVYWLSQRNAEIPNEYKDDDWLIINVQSIGFYRVLYDKESWNKIIKVLTSDKFEQIHESNRASIVDDLLNLARAGLLDYEITLRGIQYLKRETNYLPFKSALTGLDYLIKKFSTVPDYDIFKEHIISLFANIYEKIGFDDKPGDDQLTILLRQIINVKACKLQQDACIEKSQKYFSEWRTKHEIVSKNQRSTVYCTAIKHGTKEDWEFLWEQYKKSNVATEQQTILDALACSQNTEMLDKLLRTALTSYKNSYIHKQNVLKIFSSIAAESEEGAAFIIHFAEKNQNTIFKFFDNSEEIGNIISYAMQYYPTKKIIQKIENVMKSNETHLNAIKSSLEKNLKIANFELDWFKKNSPIIISWIIANENYAPYRLPNTVIPSAYTIHLTPFIIPNNFTFNGIVKITANVMKSTRNIVLHMDQITINNLTVFEMTGATDVPKKLVVSNIVKTEKYNFLDIFMETVIKAGTKININIAYTGILNSEMRGFYKSSYKMNNETRWLAATHLEPVAARKVFPCFDEPALKSTFKISVHVPKNYTALSNMPVKSKSNGVWQFYETPVMSTYLVAVVVSDFDSRKRNIDNREYGVWSSPPMVQYLSYSLELMNPIVNFLERNLGVSYGLPKLDMVGIPDFTSGAMENWGLLVFRETNLLYDEGRTSSIISKQLVRNVVAHEIAHQWFGNLVSPLRWDYLWLSEGFARYFQYHAYSEAESTWNLELQFVVDHLQTSYAVDASTSTHPVTHKVYSPSEIKSIFDKISYAKAASLIRMIEKLVGPRVFYNALHDYLEDRKFSTGTPEALFSFFQSQMSSNAFNVTKFMYTWTKQSGFPVVNVVFRDDTAILTQMRFFSRPMKNETSKNLWIVPINWATKSNPNFNDTKKVVWLDKKSKSITIKHEIDDWVIINVQQTGYYRVNYDTTMWRRILAALNSHERHVIHEINRAALIDDMLNLGRAGYLDYDIVFAGTRYLANETAYGPWKAAYNGFSYLNGRFEGHPEIYDSYRTYILNLLEPNLKRLGYIDIDGEVYTDILLRKLVLQWLCDMDHPECVQKATLAFQDERNDRSIPANYRSFVYCTAIRHGTAEDWNYLWKKYKNSNYAIEKVTILSALACSENSTNLERLLHYTIRPGSHIRLQDAKRVFSDIIDTTLTGVKTTLNFILRNYESLQKYFYDDGAMKNILTSISKRLPTNQMVAQFDYFINEFTKNVPSIGKTLQSSLKRAKVELNWYNERAPKILEYLDKHNDQSAYRLPTFAKPESYNIFLRPYFEERNFTFDGNVSIDITVNTNTYKIVLHAEDLNITNIYSTNKLYQITSQTYNISTNMLSIYFGRLLSAGTKFQLNFNYTGYLKDDMKGFYRSYYTDNHGNTLWLATTQFEPTYARRAFPCFDEPSFKSNFTIHIAKPQGYRTLSNMGSSPKERNDTGDRIWDDYQTSIRMSPYTLAFIVFDFVKYPETPSKLSIWTKPQLIGYMNYSYNMGQQTLNILENLTQISYPLKEMNFVAVPDFNSGAMENWGLVTYREYGLTYDKWRVSASYKRYVNTVISHELAHMWFGNLVTCEWWDYTWLNEGFAEYFSHVVSDSLEPRWKLMKQFIVINLHIALGVDASDSSHAMNNKVLKPSEVQNGFDKIAYAKSASVIRMFDHSFGRQIFIESVRNYLESNKYENARPEYLTKAFQDSVDKEGIQVPGHPKVNVTTIINSWTYQPGYPVVNATRYGDKLFFSQKRFLISPSNTSENNEAYWIPITYTTDSELDFKNLSPRLWLGKQQQHVSLQENNTWFIVNIQEIGFYRVNYDAVNWQRLIEVLNSDKFSFIEDVNRAQIVDDSFNLARAGQLDYEVALDLSKYLVRETNYLPWKAYLNVMTFIRLRIQSRPNIVSLFNHYMLSLITDIFEKLGFEDDMTTETIMDQLNRENILTLACKLDYKKCIQQSRMYFGKPRISPNAAVAVYCTTIRHGTSHEWNLLWHEFLKADLITDAMVILKGLGCSKNSTILERYLNLIIAPNSKVRRQDRDVALSSVYGSSRVGLKTAVTYFQNNLNRLYDYFGNWEEVGSLFKSLTAYISVEEDIEELEKWSNEKIASKIQSTVKSGIKSAKNNLKWTNTYIDKIYTWLAKNYAKL